jgi:agmatine deiminase
MKAEDGTPLEVRSLPMPPRVDQENLRLPASYANFYIANKVILLPVFCSPKDKSAYEIIQNCFPERRVIPIDCTQLVWGLGAFHCLTQQQPAI